MKNLRLVLVGLLLLAVALGCSSPSSRSTADATDGGASPVNAVSTAMSDPRSWIPRRNHADSFREQAGAWSERLQG